MRIDTTQLEAQAEALSHFTTDPGFDPAIVEKLQGLWNFCHAILDERDSGAQEIRLELVETLDANAE